MLAFRVKNPQYWGEPHPPAPPQKGGEIKNVKSPSLTGRDLVWGLILNQYLSSAKYLSLCLFLTQF